MFCRKTGNSIDGFFACFSGFGSGDGSLKLEDLLQERPIKEVIELAAGGESSDFQAPVSFAGECGRLEILGWTAHAR